ncbi:phospholipase ABHD3-like [Anneissia japonica]|uniref:phospholipase ABHD3-like n=1 Tax=Anneissia japonica TaxID=1529436 RepID=UPI00142563B6|nr:phospholipase ABHD3-like [Anneissia japonica]
MLKERSLTIFAGVVYFVYYIVKIVKKPGVYSGPRLTTFLLSHCESLKKKYWPTFWCIGAHLQTVLPTFIQLVPQHHYRREIILTKDGGEIILHWEDNQEGGKMYEEENRPTVIILPGLTGCSSAGYVMQMVDSVVRLGYRAVVFNYRGLGGAQLKTPRTYCAANTDDLELVIKHVHDLYPSATLMAAGTSLGGIILFNYLAKQGHNTPLAAAFTVSTAWNMFESTKEIEMPLNRWILNYPLARNLRSVLQSHIHTFKGCLDPNDLEDALKATTIREFDASFTAKIFGYANVDEYYADACLHKKIHSIKIPTVCMNAENDPFSPLRALPIEDSCSQDNVALIVTSHGGHLGFPESVWPSGKSLWHCIFADVVDAVFKHRNEIVRSDI